MFLCFKKLYKSVIFTHRSKRDAALYHELKRRRTETGIWKKKKRDPAQRVINLEEI